jgi:hypothetical protein
MSPSTDHAEPLPVRPPARESSARHRPARRRTSLALVAVVGAAGLLGACSSSDDPQVTESPTSSTTTTLTTTTTAAADGDGTEVTTVDANTASVDEMAAAFEAAGVANAQRWAHEVEEYRPYSDDGWAALRQELSKYNIDQDTFDKITSTLTL